MLEIKKGNSCECPGIYAIVCFENGKIYIGSSIDIYQRVRDHKYTLRKNKHINNYLQNAYNKYGEDSFNYYVIEFCLKDKLFEREQFYVNLYKSNYKQEGFNLRTIEPGNLGYTFTEDQRLKVSNGVKRKLENVEWKKARQDKITKYARSEEGRKKRSEISKESWQNPKIKEKIVKGIHASGVFETRKITHNTPEFKEKQSEISKKQWSDPINRYNMSELKKEQYITNPELKDKISKATTEAMNKPEIKEKISIAMKKFNAENPERVSEIKEAQKKTLQSAEHREKASVIAKELWNNEEHRNKMIAERKERFGKQENKDKMKEISNSMWNDPVKYKETLMKRSNITPEQFEQLKELHKLGYSQSQIAKVIGCKKEAIGRICRGESKLYSLV